jgi:hypothetical protein
MGAAFRCEICSGEPMWRIERWGDAVVTWACPWHMSRVCEGLQRDHEVTKLSVQSHAKLREWSQIAHSLATITDA